MKQPTSVVDKWNNSGFLNVDGQVLHMYVKKNRLKKQINVLIVL